ncbi:transposase domain-containing protein, partial [Thiolapillus sp.]|uniref:transposase domain-containing protein n=1 Tax=Thiolapillus sp. TaxID=2017437 RepID=UPI003AF88360
LLLEEQLRLARLRKFGARSEKLPFQGELFDEAELEVSLEDQACLRPRDRFWDIPVPKIDSAFDNLFVPQPSWSPSTTQQLRKLVAAPYLAPNDWTPRSEAYFVFPLAQGTPGKQCGLAATGVYQPSLRSPWLAAVEQALAEAEAEPKKPRKRRTKADGFDENLPRIQVRLTLDE